MGSYRIRVEREHSFLVGKEASVDNFGYLDREVGFFDNDLFDNLTLELGNS